MPQVKPRQVTAIVRKRRHRPTRGVIGERTSVLVRGASDCLRHGPAAKTRIAHTEPYPLGRRDHG